MGFTHRAIVTLMLAACGGLLPLDVLAAPLFTHDVFCNLTNCGTMEFDKYEEFSGNSAFESKNWLGGVRIHGTFTETKAATYHYVQADKNDSDDFRWRGDATVSLPQPFLDPPPGGYKARADATDNAYTSDQGFDYLPWYDEGEFPDFSDGPGGYFLSAKSQADKTLTNIFETWIICVLDVVMGANATQAKDDSYTIAPLLGWQWGYNIVYKDIGTLGVDEFADFTVTKTPFAFVTTPTAHWTDALTAKYGATGQDFWKITTGDCDDCIPEPRSGVLLMMGVVAAFGYRLKYRQ